MDPKIIILVYGLFLVGSLYLTISQALSMLRSPGKRHHYHGEIVAYPFHIRPAKMENRESPEPRKIKISTEILKAELDVVLGKTTMN